MQIYVASLADYNNGTLHGVWIDVDNTTMEDVMETINEMLQNSPTEPETAEEWEIHDTEGIPPIIYKGGLEKILEFAEYYEEYEDYEEAFYAWVDDGNDTIMEDFLDYYEGEFKSTKEFVYEWLDSFGLVDNLPDIIKGNIDIYGIWQDLSNGGDFYDIPGNDKVCKVIVTKDAIMGKTSPTVVEGPREVKKEEVKPSKKIESA